MRCSPELPSIPCELLTFSRTFIQISYKFWFITLKFRSSVILKSAYTTKNFRYNISLLTLINTNVLIQELFCWSSAFVLLIFTPLQSALLALNLKNLIAEARAGQTYRVFELLTFIPMYIFQSLLQCTYICFIINYFWSVNRTEQLYSRFVYPENIIIFHHLRLC